jgi:hypothetical protein
VELLTGDINLRNCPPHGVTQGKPDRPRFRSLGFFLGWPDIPDVHQRAGLLAKRSVIIDGLPPEFGNSGLKSQAGLRDVVVGSVSTRTWKKKYLRRACAGENVDCSDIGSVQPTALKQGSTWLIFSNCPGARRE